MDDGSDNDTVVFIELIAVNILFLHIFDQVAC